MFIIQCNALSNYTLRPVLLGTGVAALALVLLSIVRLLVASAPVVREALRRAGPWAAITSWTVVLLTLGVTLAFGVLLRQVQEPVCIGSLRREGEWGSGVGFPAAWVIQSWTMAPRALGQPLCRSGAVSACMPWLGCVACYLPSRSIRCAPATRPPPPNTPSRTSSAASLMLET